MLATRNRQQEQPQLQPLRTAWPQQGGAVHERQPTSERLPSAPKADSNVGVSGAARVVSTFQARQQALDAAKRRLHESKVKAKVARDESLRAQAAASSA
eukprot:COSAG01_NODE_3733_length_5751_cov_6.724168_9_plen_98_part_01